MSLSAPAARRLIVNADDFGRSPGVSRGIVEAHQRGIVGSTTLMTNLPWAADAVAQAATAPDLALGLHLSFSYGPPAAGDVPSLLGADGRLNRDLPALAATATEADIAREARAQLERFVALTGRLPTHLDSHLHLHTWPVCRGPVLALALECGLPVRAADPETTRALTAAGVPTTDAFINDFFAPDMLTVERLLAVIAALQPGVTELMVHPGYADAALADSSFREQREDELRVVTDPAVRHALAASGVERCTWDAVRASASR